MLRGVPPHQPGAPRPGNGAGDPVYSNGRSRRFPYAPLRLRRGSQYIVLLTIPAILHFEAVALSGLEGLGVPKVFRFG
ncbi:MAG: hypothetical protein MUE60_16505, partial [Candidatus Eisenbacteria bacterium]|nr:hypothetical protein [Candidatus Eisenbacteria bacterium]